MGLDSCVLLNNLPQGRTVVSLIKKGLVIVSLKIFSGYVDQNKKIPQYVHFKCGLLHIKDSLKNLRKVLNYNHVYLNKNLNTMKFMKIIARSKKMNGYLILKTMFFKKILCVFKNDVKTAFSHARYAKGMEELTGFGMENSSTLPTLANKYFNGLRDENNEPIYTFNDELSINIINLPFQMKYLILFQKN